MTRDAGLAARMAATIGGVLVLDAVLAAVVASLLWPWLAPLGAVAAAAGVDPVPVRVAAVVVPATGGLALAQAAYARRRLLADVDAAVVTDETRPELVGRVRRLATVMDAPVPAVAVADTDVPNSFAVGGVGEATVVVSEGLLDRLDGDQVDAVLAHELAHVRNRDAAVLTLGSFLPALVDGRFSPLAAVRSRLGGPGWIAACAVALALVLGPVVLGVGAAGVPYLLGVGAFLALAVPFGSVVLGLVASPAVVLARNLSRYREFAADRAAAAATGNPAALAAALRELDDAERPGSDLRAAGPAAGLCLLPYGFERVGEATDAANGTGRDDFAVRTRSHPPTERRIERLRELV